MEPLHLILTPFGTIWTILGSIWAVLGTICAVLGRAARYVPRQCRGTYLFRCPIGHHLGHLGHHLGQFGPHLSHLGHHLGHLVAFWEAFRGKSASACKFSAIRAQTGKTYACRSIGLLLPVVSTQIKCRLWRVHPLVKLKSE